MIRLAFILVALLTLIHAHGDLYKKLRCKSDTVITASGSGKEKIFDEDQFVVEKPFSQVLTLLDSDKSTLLKIYPWYGVHYKAGKTVEMGPIEVLEASSFRFTYFEKKSKEVHEIFCTKL